MKLTYAEQRCCHMSQCEFEDDLPQWRAEFKKIARSEKCKDCPIAGRAALKDQRK